MPTLKTLAALGALLLVASSANATLTFTVHAENPLDTDSTQSFQLDIALSAGQTLDIFGFFGWAFSSGAPVGGRNHNCDAAPQTMCSFGGMSLLVVPGVDWVWASPAAGPTGPANFTNIARSRYPAC